MSVPRQRTGASTSVKVVPDLNVAVALEPLLTMSDLGRILAVERRTIDRLRSAGKLPPPDLILGRMPRWRRSTIDGWISRGGRS
jgi:predicted DNA-binding transcriptional regulator AlpA